MHASGGWPRIGLLVLVAAGLAGCSGDDGDDGAPGPPGAPATVNIADATQLAAAIGEVTIASPPVMNFSLADGGGTAVVGLPASAISFTIAKLVPGTDGDASAWQSYINRIEEANGIGPGTEDQVQATTENGTAGELTDNGDGTYQYTYATDVANVPGVEFNSNLTHRASFEIRGFAPVINPVYDFLPATGATTGLFTREIVDDASCNVCHDQLSLHGDGRGAVQGCMSCHNPGSTDAQSGNTVDMKVMAHKIHYGADLPSVVDGGQYVIYGFRDRPHDYSNVVYPQDIRNCRGCHDENNPDTPDAGNWISVPTAETCGSCHDDVNFETGENHGSGISAGNDACANCHRPGGDIGVEEAHVITEKEAAAAFELSLIEVVNTAPGEFPVAKVSVTDPTNADTPYDILNDPAIDRLRVNIAWDNFDINNTGSGSGSASGTPAQPFRLDVKGDGVDNLDGTFTVTSADSVPAFVEGSGTAAAEARGRVDGNRVPIGGESIGYAITDGLPIDRRKIVDIDSCNGCHGVISLHGSNRTDNIELCVTCHNSNATDIAERIDGGVDSSNSLDGKDEETIEFKTMVHAIHRGEERDNAFVVYGRGGNPADFGEVVYPGNLANCEGCHLSNTYYPVGAFALAATIDIAADIDDPYDDLNITPNAAACWGCHDRPAAVSHMEQFGGAFDAVQTVDGTLISQSEGTVIETCDVCHGPGRSADVGELHGL